MYDNNWFDKRYQDSTLVEVGYIKGSFIDLNTRMVLYDKIYSIVARKIDYKIIDNIYENLSLLNKYCYDSLEDFLVCYPNKEVSKK